MQLDDIAPWGRSYTEYRAMFALAEGDLGGRIIGVGDGPADFNAEAHARGQDVTSVDPIYAFTVEEIRDRIRTVCPQIEAGVRANPTRYVWDHFPDIDSLIAYRLDAMDRFLKDYPGPGMSPRYRAGGFRGYPTRTTPSTSPWSRTCFSLTPTISVPKVTSRACRNSCGSAERCGSFPC